MKRNIINWQAIDLNSAKGTPMLMGAVQHFLSEVSTPEAVAALQHMAIQHFTNTEDFPAQAKMIAKIFQDRPTYDEGWRNVFDVLDFTGTNRSSFDIDDVSHGIVIRKMRPGDRAEVYKAYGDTSNVPFSTYGGAIGWQNDWLSDAEYYKVERALAAFRDFHYQKRSSVIYGLLEAMGSTYDTAWAAPVPALLPNTDANYVAIRDIETINTAIIAIIANLKNTGIMANAQSAFVITAPVELKPRIDRAIGLMNVQLAGSNYTGVRFNVTAQYTTHFTTLTKYYVSLPGQKNNVGIRQEMTVKGPVEDILANAQHAAAFMRYGGAIGDTRQHSRCATS